MNGERERILNLPGVVTAMLVVLALVQFALETLPDAAVLALVERFAFIPLRFSYLVAPQATLSAIAEGARSDDGAAALSMLLDGAGGAWLTPFTYTLMHGDWTHLAINALSLAAFGSPVARRFGPRRFVGFLAVNGLAGALAHWLLHPLDVTPVIGASAAISGTMAAVARFAFVPGGPLGERRLSQRRKPEEHPAAGSLAQLASNQRAVFFLAAWFGVNLLFGLFPEAAGSSNAIAWEAHMGGFLAGLLLFTLFDPESARGRSAD